MKKPVPFVSLAEICTEDRTPVLADAVGNEVLRYVGMEHVESNSGRILSAAVKAPAITGLAFRFDFKHVLYGKLRPYLNKVALPDFAGRCSTELIPLLPNEDVNRSYLAYLLRRPETVDAAMGEKTGSRMPRADMSLLMRLRVPLPPIEHQREIVKRLDEQLAAAARARAAVAAQLEAAERLIRKWIDQQFPDPQQPYASAIRLDEVADIQAGVTLGKEYSPKDAVSAPYLRVANVKDGQLDLTHVKQIGVPTKVADALALRFGDLLLTEGGDPDKLGRGTLWQDELPLCIHQNHIFRVRFDLAKFDPFYLSIQFRSAYAKAYFLAHAKQTTGIASINQQVLRGYPLIAPSLAEQRRLAEAFRVLNLKIGDLVSALTAQLADLDRLPGALLREAFTF